MYRAIVVDDEPFMLEGMRLMINWAACGFELAGEAGTAQDALRLVDQLHPDLVITDIRMPGLLGTDLAELLARYHPDTMVLFFSGYRDFEYAKAAIQSHVFGYLLKPIDQDEVAGVLLNVKAALDTRRALPSAPAVPVIRDHVLRRLAFGDDSTEALLQSGLLLGVGRDETVCCAVIELTGAAGDRRVEDLFSLPGATCFLLSPAMLGVLFRGDANLSALSGRKAELESSEGLALRIGVGRLGRGGEGFRESLRQAIDALGPWFTPEGDARRYRPYDQQAAQWMIDADAVALEKALLARQKDAFESQLRKLEKAYQQKKPSLFCLRLMAHNIGIALAQDGEQGQPFDSWWREESCAPRAWMDGFVQALREYAEARFSESDAVPEAVGQVLAYIEESYQGDASISDVAKKLYMNPAYLGQLVRKHTGKTFHKHLLDARMDRACRLLRQTSMTVSDIAKAVGVRDVDYFTAQFKKHLDMSPNAYRSASAKEVQ